MISADLLMKQAGMTAHDWMLSAKEFVEQEFADYPPQARATLIAAYVNAAAGDELAMYLRELVEVADKGMATLENIGLEAFGVKA